MPLPPPPSKRAARLTAEALAAIARARRHASRKQPAPNAVATHAAAAHAVATPTIEPQQPVAATAATTATAQRRTSANPHRAAPLARARATLPAAANGAAHPAGAARRERHARSTAAVRKLFVLDTNVLMHDPTCLFRFEEHDIFLPMVTLEELDGHKKGTTEVARNARQASRYLDELVSHQTVDIADGLMLSSAGHREATGRLFFQTRPLDTALPVPLPPSKADNQILGVVHALTVAHPEREVALVSKDINMRVKARTLGLRAEDYTNDKTLDDGELLYTGVLALPADFWDKHGKTMESWQQGGYTYYRITGPAVPGFLVNQFIYFEAPGAPALYAKVTEIRGRTAVLKTLRDYTHAKNAVWGVTARNREQNFALNLLMDPEIDFVTLAGQAGTGKTLMTLAAGLTQVLDARRYSEIIVTRVTVPLGEDIGFLPGTEEEKMGPWMGALDDNLEVLAKTDGVAGEWGRAATAELVRSKIRIKSLNFMRGRTFLSKYVIIDEAQNLTPKQMKTLITRAGPGTKIICMGNLAQIDTPYLTEGSSGLTYVVDRFKGWPHDGHVTLARGERSRLADFASEVL